MTMSESLDKTALSWWFPKIEAAGLPVPRTKIISMPSLARDYVWTAFDGKEGGADQRAAFEAFCGEIAEAGAEFGFPCFLRTDLTSAKHGWERTCYLPTPEDIPAHVFAIAEFSECADIFGLDWSTWAVREMLPTIPLGTCPGYGNMPVCREFRVFVDDGVGRCAHPYWPRAALEQGGADTSICAEMVRPMVGRSGGIILALAMRAGAALGGSWSVDILETSNGWYVTDLAEAHKSFHWEGCPHADSRPQPDLPKAAERG